MDKFIKDTNIMNGKGESEEMEWITVNGTHIPIKDGESPKEAIKKHFEEKETKQNQDEVKFTKDSGTFAEYKRLQELGIEPKIKTITLPKQEYAELCSAIRTKCGNKIKKYDSILYKDCYYKYNYSKRQERIVCIDKIDIIGNEKLIKKLENWNGRKNNGWRRKINCFIA